eukprot:3636444-Amphidinium_carterae.1
MNDYLFRFAACAWNTVARRYWPCGLGLSGCFALLNMGGQWAEQAPNPGVAGEGGAACVFYH